MNDIYSTYKVNPKYISELEDHGMKFVGRCDEGKRMEIFELDGEYINILDFLLQVIKYKDSTSWILILCVN